ncbi:RNA polymerase-binding protein RbpA [Microbacterium halophytorum]|uniref:RNA polymerase-binding protein RbpA n=1 Tax=Microbacterium halophytorum TaxID=2067568 RepID=UPI000CFAA25D|nr:RNA polymerase-binding protein RbpA [Microbacterium halophytorum]
MAAGGGSAIRGTRIGSGPMGEQDHGYQAERRSVSYWDAEGNETVRWFAADVPDDELPAEITHPKSGLPAGRDRENPPSAESAQPYKTHLAYVQERRTEAEAEELLDEALHKLRERRGQ